MTGVGCRAAAAAMLLLLLLCGSVSADSHFTAAYWSLTRCIVGYLNATIPAHNHRWECPTAQQALTGFGFGDRVHYGDCSDYGIIRAEGHCMNMLQDWDLPPNGAYCYNVATAAQPWWLTTLGLEGLLEHDLKCGPQEVMQAWAIERHNYYYLTYRCCVVGGHWNTTTEHATACARTSSWDAATQTRKYDPFDWLELLQPQCPEGAFLQSFHFSGYPSCILNGDRTTDDYENGMRIEYTCLSSTLTREADTSVGCTLIGSTIQSLALFWKIGCPFGHQSLNGFHLDEHDCAWPDQAGSKKFKTQCTALPKVWNDQPRKCTKTRTACVTGFTSDAGSLAAHEVDCGLLCEINMVRACDECGF
ncbi:hypothetical protein DIPPA_14697 [Diplonema papillatum]|nr:hypothetical protein DIPPA_14697 [Diplonema papillatum]